MTASDNRPPTAAPEVVRLRDVAKRFVLRKDNSLKERLVTLGRLGKKHREEFWALNGVDLTITAGSTIGLIGHNGSGKSTLLKVIGGIIGTTRGSVESRGRIAALLELGAGFHPDLTGRENVYLNASILGMSRKETDERFPEILAFAGIGEFIDTQVKFYSSGMYVRLAFAVAVHTDPDILLVDEVLAVGDESFQRKCLDKIRSFQEEGRTIVLVTHALGQVIEFCDRAVLLNRGEVVFDGDPTAAVGRFREILETRDRDDAVAQGRTVIPAISLAGAAIEIGGERHSADDRPVLQLGQDLVLELTFASDGRDLDQWACAIQIDDDSGHRVFNADSSMTEPELHESFSGTRTTRIRLNDCRFGAGRYFVNVSVLDSLQRHLHDAPHALSFEVETPLPGRGHVSLAVDFELLP